MSFTDEEIAYLRSQPIARLATVGEEQQPDVVPVGFEFDGVHFWVGGSGETVLRTRKFRNVAAGAGKVALVIDDMVSFDPFIVRGIRVYGDAAGPVERVGMMGPGFYIRITPSTSWTWNMAGRAGRGDVVRVQAGAAPPLALCRPLPQQVDPLPELGGAGRRRGRATALLAQGGVGDPVRLTGAVVPRRHEAVELPAHHRELLVRRCLARWRRGRGCTTTGPLALPMTQQVAHLVGLEQARDPEEVHLLLRPDVHLPGVAELRSVVQHPVEGRLRAEGLPGQVDLVGGAALGGLRPSARPRRRRCRPRR